MRRKLSLLDNHAYLTGLPGGTSGSTHSFGQAPWQSMLFRVSDLNLEFTWPCVCCLLTYRDSNSIDNGFRFFQHRNMFMVKYVGSLTMDGLALISSGGSLCTAGTSFPLSPLCNKKRRHVQKRSNNLIFQKPIFVETQTYSVNDNLLFPTFSLLL